MSLEPVFSRNDKTARMLILTVSFVVFAAVVVLSKVELKVNLGFNPHVFATINAFLNSGVSILLISGLVAVKRKNFELHRKLMLTAILLSVLFLVSYIAHHLLTGDTIFGGSGAIRTLYLTILISHIFLAAVILPFILFTAYHALTSNFKSHKKLARYTWPLWFYVSVTGVIVYLMIAPYYQ